MEEWVVGLLVLLGTVLLFVIEFVAYGGVATWLDIRAARTADEVRKNIEDYGPDAPGLKLRLLPEEERRAILAARDERRHTRAG